VGFLYKDNASNPGMFNLNTHCTYNPHGEGDGDVPYTQSLVYNSVDCLNRGSDAWELDTWSDHFTQLVTIPEGVDRIVGVSFAGSIGGNDWLTWTVTVREGNVDGPVVFSKTTQHSVHPFRWFLGFGVNDCPVTPGQQYAFQYSRVGGMNTYRMGNVYSGGILYRGSTPLPGNDVIGYVVGMNSGSSAPTPTGTLPPTPVRTPTPGPVVLHNPGFDGEDGFPVPSGSQALPGNYAWVYQSIGEIMTPTWWYPFWGRGPVPNQPEVNFRRPEYKVTSLIPPWDDPLRVDAGEHSCQYFGFSGQIDAGFYQPVEVTPQHRYRFWARAHSWTSCEDDQYQSGCEAHPWDPAQCTFRVGIDPYGGTDYESGNIVWGAGAHIYDEFEDIPAVEATALGSTITVFIRSVYRWGYKHNDSFVDSAQLIDVTSGPASSFHVE
jgi:hypothetical protein